MLNKWSKWPTTNKKFTKFPQCHFSWDWLLAADCTLTNTQVSNLKYRPVKQAFGPQRYRRHTHNTNNILKLVCLLHLLFNVHLCSFFISLPPVIVIIFRRDGGHSVCVCLCVCVGGVCVFRAFSVTPISLHSVTWQQERPAGYWSARLSRFILLWRDFRRSLSPVHFPVTHRAIIL